MRIAPEAREWTEKCKNLEKFADEDGVVPLVAINKEQPGAERVRHCSKPRLVRSGRRGA